MTLQLIGELNYCIMVIKLMMTHFLSIIYKMYFGYIEVIDLSRTERRGETIHSA